MMSQPTAHAPVPAIGEEVYVPSSFYLSRGSDDVCGGKATVKSTAELHGTVWVYVDEVPDRGYNWRIIGPEQETYRREYAGKTAHRCPDDHPSANTGGL